MAKSLKTPPFEPVPFVIYRQGTAPDPPPELAEGGATLWRAILSETRFRKAAQLEVLRQACLCRDKADRLRQQIEDTGDVAYCDGGSMKNNPLLNAEAIAQNQVVTFLAKLGVLDDGDNESRMGRPPNQKPSA
jgi:hypothetical protein